MAEVYFFIVTPEMRSEKKPADFRQQRSSKHHKEPADSVALMCRVKCVFFLVKSRGPHKAYWGKKTSATGEGVSFARKLSRPLCCSAPWIVVEEGDELVDGLACMDDCIVVEKQDVFSVAVWKCAVVSSCEARIARAWQIDGVSIGFNNLPC